MANHIRLSWSVDASESSLDPAQAAAALGAVVLYQNAITDPLLGQMFGLTVASDVTSPTGTGAIRTLDLAMTSAAGSPLAPPPFPCHPVTPTPPVPPYKLQRNVTLPGDFTVQSGSTAVLTEFPQKPSLNIGDTVQFSSQLGVSYTIATVTPAVSLTTPYTGKFATTAAFKVLPAPATLFAIYSTSALDNSSGSGARRITLSYLDSNGAPGTITVTLAGKRPVQGVLAGGTIDIATVVNMNVSSTGGFQNSVGQITLSELSAPIVNTGIANTDDQAQMKLARALVYLPPSYFALAQQGASQPSLDGDFLVSPDSADVVTTVDQTSNLTAGNVVQFVTDPGVDYTVAAVTPKIVTLTARYGGLLPATTGATCVSPSQAVPPTDEQLKATLGQYTNPGNVLPSGDMVPPPSFLSSLYARTIALALAVPVTSSAITLS